MHDEHGAGGTDGALELGRPSAQRWLELILEHTRTGVDVIDASFSLHYVDPGWRKVYGDYVGQKCYRYFMGRDSPCPGCGIPEAFRTGRVQVTEEILPREAGRIVEVHTIPFQDTPGHWLVAEFNLDVTARKQTEGLRLEQERRQLHAQKLESLGLMAGGIAHDFNNLLQAILGNLDLARTGPGPHEHLDAAVWAAQRATDLSRQMLAYSGRGHFLVQPVDVGAFVQANVHLLRAATPRNVEFLLALEEGLPRVLADPGQLQQVVMNLLVNAAEAIGERPGRVELAVSAGFVGAEALEASLLVERPAPGVFVRIRVTDDGCGMGDETRRRMFDPFYSTKQAGRGLGMPVVLGIMRGHRGAILVESQAGCGSRVELLLPAVEGESPRAAPASGSSSPVEGEPVRGAGLTVLVVDDETMVREVSRAMLERLGHSVLEACDGLEALEVFGRHQDEVACVLLDLTMPRMDGLAALVELRRLKPELGIILTSGYSEQEAVRRVTGPVPDAFLQKPFRYEELAQALGGLGRRG